MLAKYLYRPQIEAASGHCDEGNDNVAVSDDNLAPDCTKPIVQELISPNEVVKALRQFVEDNNEPSRYVSFTRMLLKPEIYRRLLIADKKS